MFNQLPSLTVWSEFIEPCVFRCPLHFPLAQLCFILSFSSMFCFYNPQWWIGHWEHWENSCQLLKTKQVSKRKQHWAATVPQAGKPSAAPPAFNLRVWSLSWHVIGCTQLQENDHIYSASHMNVHNALSIQCICIECAWVRLCAAVQCGKKRTAEKRDSVNRKRLAQ